MEKDHLIYLIGKNRNYNNSKFQPLSLLKYNITINPEDINFYKSFKKKIFKIGIGYDIHRFDFKKKNGLKLCGVKIPYYKLVKQFFQFVKLF